MSIRLKLIMGFGMVALVSGIIGYKSITQVEKLATPLIYEIPVAAEAENRASRLFNEAHLIRYYDEVLTQSARNFAFTQDEKWADRYGDVEPLLDQSIKRALHEGDETDGQLFAQVDSANLALVAMEYRAILLVDQGRASEAVSILESEEYWDQKQVYWTGLKGFLDRVEARDQQAHEISSNAIKAATALAESEVETASSSLWIFAGVLLVVTALAGTIVGRSITQPLNQMTTAVIELGKGNYNVRTNNETSDEFGAVARSIDRLAVILDDKHSSDDPPKSEIAEITESVDRLL